MTVLTVSENTIITDSAVHYDRLLIEKGAALLPPEGKALTMTAGGAETAIVPGEYADVTLTTSDILRDIIDGYNGYEYRCALCIDENGVDEKHSNLAAISGEIGGKSLKNGLVRSENEFFGGIIINGGEYSIEGLDANLTGPGGSDFAGVGMGLLCVRAKVEAKNLRIRNTGVIRGAVFVADYSDVHITDSDIYTAGGTEEEALALAERIWNPSIPGPKPMTKVPWALGLRGTNRATNIVGTGTVSYENCTLRANEWGVLSTDGPDEPSFPGEYRIHLNTKNCLVELTGPSGYGAYSIAATQDVFDSTTFNVPSYGVIIANEHASAILKNGTVINSGRFGLMYHQNQGGLTEITDSTVKAGLVPILIKGCYPDIRVENSVIESGSGVIVQLMDSDDPRRGFGWYEFEPDAATAEKDESHDIYSENIRDYKMQGFPFRRGTDAKVAFKGVSLSGDIYNSMKNASSIGMEKIDPSNDHKPGAGRPKPSVVCCVNLLLSLEDSGITGRISSSEARHRVAAISPDNREELGLVDNSPAPAVNNGVLVTLLNSRWTVTGKSYLTGLDIDGASAICRPDGSPAEMSVNGKAVTLLPGKYSGDIVIC